ncbi:MAG: preprotein translocase subunit SecE [Actinomycetota bacterium]
MAAHKKLAQWLVRFLHEVSDELRKVVWPSGREVRTYAIVVVVAVVMATVFVFALDQLFNHFVIWLFDH